MLQDQLNIKKKEKEKEKKTRQGKARRPSPSCQRFECAARFKSCTVRAKERQAECRRERERGEKEKEMGEQRTWSVSRKCAYHMRRMWRNFALMVIVTFSACQSFFRLSLSLSSFLALSLGSAYLYAINFVHWL